MKSGPIWRSNAYTLLTASSMKNKFLALLGVLAGAHLLVAAPWSFERKPADLSRLVVVGDSLAAGVQNFSLLESQQPHGFAKVIADQAGVPLVLPLVPSPGAPNVLQLVTLGPPPVIEPAPGTLPIPPRLNPTEQPTDLAVPGVTVHQALTMRPSLTGTDPVQGWANIVLGFPTPFVFPGQPKSEIQQAVALRPTTVIMWLGNNDALVPALFGAIDTLTNPRSFFSDYDEILDRLRRTGASIITANIPDIAAIPFFTSAADVAAQAHLSLHELKERTGISRGDYIRPGAAPLIADILSGKTAGPLPELCPAPSASPVPQVPCVLRKHDVRKLRNAIAIYNAEIAFLAAVHHVALFDAHAWFDGIRANGYDVAGKHLTAGFLGGIVSLDGIHPTNTGYAIIANEFIKIMNRQMGTHIPFADIASIAAQDPLIFPH
jgi:hypothetical protein